MNVNISMGTLVDSDGWSGQSVRIDTREPATDGRRVRVSVRTEGRNDVDPADERDGMTVRPHLVIDLVMEVGGSHKGAEVPIAQPRDQPGYIADTDGGGVGVALGFQGKVDPYRVRSGAQQYSPMASRPPSRLGCVTSQRPVAGAISRQIATAHTSKSCSRPR